MTWQTEQEQFWAGEFGNEYLKRNDSEALLTTKILTFGDMLRKAHGVTSVMELGCNIGLNLEALKRINPSLELTGYEINEEAAKRAAAKNVATINRGSILDPITDEKADLTFTSGVLIHINPDYLDNVYQNLVNASNRYVLVSEYYSPEPVEITYRGHEGRLFKRDFAGDLIDKYGLKLVNYGFCYRRDNLFVGGDSNWFLLEK